MPISPANMLLYPGGSIRSPEWLVLREQVRERAGNKCEGCGVENGARIVRYLGQVYHYVHGTTAWIGGSQFKIITIVCTVAHVDGKLVDHSLDNLRFWCQKCHLTHDAAQHAQSRATRRRVNST